MLSPRIKTFVGHICRARRLIYKIVVARLSRLGNASRSRYKSCAPRLHVKAIRKMEFSRFFLKKNLQMHTFRKNSKRSYYCPRWAPFVPVCFVYRSFSDFWTPLENFRHRFGYRFSAQFSNLSPIFRPNVPWIWCVHTWKR